MLVTFTDISATIEADSPKDAYESLDSALSALPELVQWVSGQYQIGAGSPRDTVELFP